MRFTSGETKKKMVELKQKAESAEAAARREKDRERERERGGVEERVLLCFLLLLL